MDSELTNIRRVAVGLLARREHSVFELKQKLVKHKYDINDIDTVLTELTNKSLQSDERFTESFCRYRMNQGFGPLRIQKELQQRGVHDGLIQHYCQAEDHFWLAQLDILLQKRLTVGTELDIKTRSKQIRFFQYRGFPLGLIKQAIKQYENSSIT